MKVPFLDLRSQYRVIRAEAEKAVSQILESQKFILGPQVEEFEREIAGFCHVPAAVGVASGTDALLLSLRALGAGPGDSVVTAPYTFFATAGAIVNAGARPLFVDIAESDYNMDPQGLVSLLEHECGPSGSDLLHRASGTRVKAVIPVHLFGQCADMRPILEAARRFGLAVVEDSCQAIGATYGDRPAGSMGDLGCFSFFPSKNLGGAGDGGMVTSREAGLAERVKLLRGHGAGPKYFHKLVGFNSRLDELQASILRVKLRHLGAWTAARQSNAGLYLREFESAGLARRLGLPKVLPGRTHVYHQFVVRCERRDDLRAHLAERGVDTEIYYPVALHEQECFLGLGYAPSDFPVASRSSKETLALPIYPELTPEQIRYTVTSIAEFYSRGG